MYKVICISIHKQWTIQKGNQENNLIYDNIKRIKYFRINNWGSKILVHQKLQNIAESN